MTEILEDAATALLTDARRVRVLDDAIRCARTELDELAGMIVRLPDVERVPAEISTQLREIAARMDRLEAERGGVLAAIVATADACA